MFAAACRSCLAFLIAVAALPAAAATSPDAQFAMQAAQGGMAEVQSGQLASTKSRSAVVRAFAQKMVADHTANNAQLAAIMRSEGLTVPTTVDPNNQAVMMRLQRARGRAFDRLYLRSQVAGHQQMQILMQSEINGGKDTRLKSYARATLSAVNMHLALAKSDVAKLRSRASASGGAMSGGAMSGGSTSGGAMSSPMPGGAMSSPMPGGAMPSSPMPNASMSPSGSTAPGSAMPASPNPSPQPR